MQSIEGKQTSKEIGRGIDKVIGERIRQRRVVLGLNQQDVSEHLGITYQQFQKYEKGTNRVSASRLFLLSKILGVDIHYFYEGVENTLSSSMPAIPQKTENFSNGELRRLSKAYSSIENEQVRQALLKFVSSFNDQD